MVNQGSGQLSRRTRRRRNERFGLSPLQWLLAAVMVGVIGILALRATNRSADNGIPTSVFNGVLSAGCGDGCIESDVTVKVVGSCPLSAADRAAGIQRSYDLIRSNRQRNPATGQQEPARLHYTAFERSAGEWESDATPDNAVCGHL